MKTTLRNTVLATLICSLGVLSTMTSTNTFAASQTYMPEETAQHEGTWLQLLGRSQSSFPPSVTTSTDVMPRNGSHPYKRWKCKPCHRIYRLPPRLAKSGSTHASNPAAGCNRGISPTGTSVCTAVRWARHNFRRSSNSYKVRKAWRCFRLRSKNPRRITLS